MLLWQKAGFEQKLKERLSFLAGKGIEPPRADRDTLARKLKATIKAVNRRLSMIAADQKRTEEMARIKTERAAAARQEREGGPAEKPKKTPETTKDKKAKAEKKAPPPKAPQGGQGQTPAASPEEGKAAAKK
jgi:hypothetical protein